jgi:hypothetical protein
MTLPPEHRTVDRFYLGRVLVAGRYRWCEWVRVVQRLEPAPFYPDGEVKEWVDIGFYDEFFPAKEPAMEEV